MEFIEKIEKIDLKNNVGYALNQSVRELLPDKIRENNLARWIIDFPGLGESNKDSDYPQLDINSIVKIISNLSRRDEKQVGYYKEFPKKSISNRENPLDNILDTIIQNSLTPNISFYFSSLFHLGRQWQVSVQALETTEKALKKDNLTKTVDHNLLVLHDELIKLELPKEEHESYLSEALSKILITAQNQHSESLSQSQKWWAIWQEEVSILKEIVRIIDQEIGLNLDKSRSYKDTRYRYLNRLRRDQLNYIFPNLIRLTTFSFSENLLYQEFLEAGITFKGINLSDRNQESLILNNLAYLSLFSMMTNEKEFSESDLMIIFSEYHDLIRELQKLQHKKRYAPIDRKVEEQLLKDFEQENHFEYYGVCKSPPDQFLIDLWNKCKLPSGETFYYAQNWLNSLKSGLSFWNRELPFTSNLTYEYIDSYARSIDSTIKRAWISGYKIRLGDEAGKTDTDLIQELYEQECIVELVKGAVYPLKEKKGEQKWNLDNFREMIERVVQFLNERGYNLETPSKARLENLWNLAIKERIYSSTEW